MARNTTTVIVGGITIPMEYPIPKPALGDVIVAGSPSRQIGLRVSVLLRTDGSWEHYRNEISTNVCHYMFLEDGRGVLMPYIEDNMRQIVKVITPPTDAQSRTIARWSAGIDVPYGMACGGPLTEWGFNGLSWAEIAVKYLDDGKVPLLA